MKTIILGSTGMLGSMVLSVFQKSNISVIGFDRDILDAESDENTIKNTLSQYINKGDWVINCIGLIKQNTPVETTETLRKSIAINSIFPSILADISNQKNANIIQIATDCVYSGSEGRYSEESSHNPEDIYGKTKSIGEINAPNFYNIRCSIIGPEKKTHKSLLDWFLNQPINAEINGFTNHKWNGITTYHFAKICLGIIQNDFKLKPLQHIVPSDILSKYDMLMSFRKYFNREDVVVNKHEAEQGIDRSLSTIDNDFNQNIWGIAGYSKIPSIDGMIKELSEHDSFTA